MAKLEKLPIFVKSEENKKPVSCTFSESGVHYGYSYNAGEQGVVREGDVEELVKRKVIINPRPFVDNAKAKGAIEKATA